MTADEIKQAHQYAQQLKAQQGEPRGLSNVEALKPEFYQARVASEPREKPAEIVQPEKGAAFSGSALGRAYPDVKLVYPQFNDAAQGNEHGEPIEGRNSAMVEKEQPKNLNRPPREIADPADRQKHNADLKQERQEVAKLEEAKAKAAAIHEKQQAASPQQSLNKGL